MKTTKSETKTASQKAAARERADEKGAKTLQAARKACQARKRLGTL